MQNNPQYIRTDKAIQQALIKLLNTKSFEKITVQDILDETPVTRSTFYKHYHDKYEIVERMQEEFFEAQSELSIAAHKNPYLFTPALINQSNQNRDLMNALLKVHTEHVDLRQAMAKQSSEYYLSTTNSPTSKVESEIFAQMITAFRLTNPSMEDFSFEYMYNIYISVFFKILGVSNDDNLRNDLLKRALNQPSFFE